MDAPTLYLLCGLGRWAADGEDLPLADDVDVSVDAEARVGQLEVFGENDEGFRNSLIVDQPGDGPGSATLEIDLEIGAGHGVVDYG